jgi:hypothetical protein
MTDPFSFNMNFVEATRVVPSRPHLNTIRRWATQGVRGVKLQTVKIGGRYFTSREALGAFIAHLSDPGTVGAPEPSGPVLERRAKAAERARDVFRQGGDAANQQ